MDVTSGDRQGVINLQVRTMATGTHNVQVPTQATVAELKQLLVRPTGLPVERQRMIYSGRVLEDGQALSAVGVADGHTLHLVEQDPAQQRPDGQPRQAGSGEAQQMHPHQFFQAMFGAAGMPGMPGMPAGAEVQAQVMGPFDASDVNAWQHVQQQIAAALGGMPGAPGDGPPQAGAAQPGAGAAGAGVNASGFNFANMFAPPAGGRGGQGRRHGRGGRGEAAYDPHAAAQGWAALQQHMQQQQQESNAHLFDGLARLLRQMESVPGPRRGARGRSSGHPGEQTGDGLPGIHLITPDLDGVPPEQRAPWRSAMANWQRNYVLAARAVLATAQLSGATRAAVNRVLEAAGAAPLRLSASGGSRAVERRVRSFPLLEGGDSDAEAETSMPGRQAAAGAGAGTAGSAMPAQLNDDPHPGLVSDADPGSGSFEESSEWEEMDAEEAAALAQQQQQGGDREEDGRVDDYVASEEGERTDDDDIPGLASASVSSEGEEGGRAPHWSQRGTQRGARDAPAALLPLGDTLLIGAVAVGELTRRFLLVMGAQPATVAAPGSTSGSAGPVAAVAEAAERLRGLTTVSTTAGPAREELDADLWLVLGYASRAAAAGAELMRALQYLHSGLYNSNIGLTRAPPGYVALHGDLAHPSLPPPRRMHIMPAGVEVVVANTVAGLPQGAQGQQGAQAWQQMLAGMLGPMMGAAAPGAGQQGAAQGGRGARPRSAAGRGGRGAAGAAPGQGGNEQQQAQQQTVRMTFQAPNGQAVPIAIPVGAPFGNGPAVPTGAATPAEAAVPPELANMAQLMLRQLGVDEAGQQALMRNFGGIIGALRQTSVTSMDVPAIGREVGAAVRQVVTQESASLRSALQAATATSAAGEQAAAREAVPEALQREADAFARRIGPAVTSEVQRVLHAQLGSLRSNPLVSAFMPYLEELGIAAATEGEDGAAQGGPGAEGPDVEQPTAAAAATEAAAPPAAEQAPVVHAPVAQTLAAAEGPTAVENAQPALAAAPSNAAAGAQPPGAVSSAAAAAPVAAASAPAASSVAGPSSSSPAMSGSGTKAAPAGLGRGFLLPRKPGKRSSTPEPSATPAERGTSAAAADSSLATAQQQQTPEAVAVDLSAELPDEPALPRAADRPGDSAVVQRSARSMRTAAQGSDRALALPGGGGGGLDLGALLGGLGGAGAGGGSGGGGLMDMLQGMMSNPAVADMVQSPAMQRMAEQMLSGSGGGTGGGGGLAGMMNAMGPMMGELLGGLAPPGAGGRRTGAPRGGPPRGASLEEVLAGALPPEEVARWKEAIEADEVRQREEQSSDGGASQRGGFSDAYLAALPPKAASGLLRLLGDDEEEATEEERSGL